MTFNQCLRRLRKLSPRRKKIALAISAVGMLLLLFAMVRGCGGGLPDDPRAVVKSRIKLTVTGYCNCGTCCGWQRNWWKLGRAEYNYGPHKGERKLVGITATGKRAARGTIAADPAVFPFGTRLRVPGYGVGKVEDIGGAIKGKHIDLWFPSHMAARAWGKQELVVEVLK